MPGLLLALSTVEHELVVAGAGLSLTPLGAAICLAESDPTLGLAGAYNAGARAASRQLVVFLEPNTLPRAGWLESLLARMESEPAVAAVGSKIVDMRGVVEHAGLVVGQDRLPRRLYAGFPGDHPAVNTSRRLRSISFACAMVRREPFLAAGGLDTRLGRRWAELDLCLRLGQAGHEIHYSHASEFERLDVDPDIDQQTGLDDRARFWDRWAERVEPDDVRYYVDDGLLSLEHWPTYPARLTVDPLLAETDDADRQVAAAQLLRARARAVFELTVEHGRLLDGTLDGPGA